MTSHTPPDTTVYNLTIVRAEKCRESALSLSLSAKMQWNQSRVTDSTATVVLMAVPSGNRKSGRELADLAKLIAINCSDHKQMVRRVAYRM